MSNKQTIAFPEECEVEARVVVTSDVDCDGTGYGYHRVLVPFALARNAGTAKWFAVQTEQMSGYGDAYEVMTEKEFEERVVPEMDEFDRAYWEREGYHGVFVPR